MSRPWLCGHTTPWFAYKPEHHPFPPIHLCIQPSIVNPATLQICTQAARVWPVWLLSCPVLSRWSGRRLSQQLPSFCLRQVLPCTRSLPAHATYRLATGLIMSVDFVWGQHQEQRHKCGFECTLSMNLGLKCVLQVPC